MLSILLVLLLELIQCEANTYSVDSSGLVINTEGYQLQGIKVNLYSNQVLIETVITNNDGSFEILKSFQSDTGPIFMLEACLSFNSQQCTQQSPTSNEILVSKSQYTIKTIVKLTVVSATQDSVVYLDRIHGQFLDSLTQSALQNVQVSFAIEFTEEQSKQKNIYQFDAKSNQIGVIDSNLLLAKSKMYILKFNAKLENYWNYYQQNDNDTTFILFPENLFKINYETKMIKGNIKQIIKGIVKSDQNSELLEGVDIRIQLKVVSKKQLLQEINIKTDNQGKFQHLFEILLWNQITININLTKDKYLPQQISLIQTYDCDNQKMTQYTQDNGIIIMGRKIFLNIKGSVFGANNQPISNQKLQITLKDETKSQKDQLPITYTPYQITTDANGQWQITDIDIRSAESISITLSYINALKQEATQKLLYVTNNQPEQQYQIKTYIQQLVQAILKGDLKGKTIIVNTNEQLLLTCQTVDNQNKPINDIIIQSTKSLFQAQFQVLAQADLPVKCDIKNGKQTLLKPFNQQFTIAAPQYNSQLEIEVQYQDATFQIKGTVTDLTTYVNQISGVQIELKDEANHVITKTQSIANGQYTIELKKEQFSTIKFQVTFSAVGFTPITTPPVSILIDVQNKVYELNKALDRNRIQIAIKDTLQNAQSQPFTKAQVTLLKSDPMIKGSTYYNEKVQTDAQGALNVKFSCYEDVDFIATFQIDIESYLPYSLATPKSKCQNLDMGISKISPKKQEVLLDISGKVIDPLMKPKQNLKMTLLIVPTPTNFTLTQLESNVKGEWTKMGVKLDAESKYTISVSYLDGVNEQIKIDFVYTTTLSPKQSLVYQDINFKDLETITIHGNIPTVQGLIPVKIPLNVVCQCEGKDKHSPTQANILTNVDNTYKVQIQCVAQSNVPIQCTLSKGDTTLIKPFTQDVTTKSPSWSTEQNLKLEIIYFTVKLTGKVLDEDKIVESIAGTSLKLIVTPQNGNIHLRRMRPRLHLDIEPAIYSAITKADGIYSFEFKVGQDDTQICDITAEESDFIEFQNKGFFIISAKQNEIQNQNIQLKRILIAAELQSILESQAYMKPLVDAKIQIMSSVPQMSIQSNYGVIVTDSEKGLFQVPFKCFKNVQYTVLLKVDVPTFVPAEIPSNKFICDSKNIQLQPTLMSSEKIEVTAIFSGKILDPYGKPKSGLNIQLYTSPETLKFNSVSLADGTWSINDPKIIPAQNYYAILQFTDIMGFIQQQKKEFLITTNNQKIEFPQINYQDYVKAEIQGKIDLARGSLSEIVSFQLVCAHSLDQNGVISQNFKSETSGQFKFDFQVLAKFTQTIECMLKPKNYLKPKEQSVKLASPLYVTQCDYEGDLDVFQFKITFTLLDQSKITNIVKDASIILLFNQPPPFVNQPSIQSGADGNAIISVSLVKGVKYILHLKIVHPEFKEFESQPILIDEEKDSEMKEKLELIRKTVIQTLESSVVDKLNKPVPSAKLSILNLTPALPDFKADPVPVEGNGSFEVKIACYYLVMEHFKFKIQIPEYADQTSSEFGFKCLGDTQQLKPVQLTLALPINVIFEGLVINPFGKPQTGLKLHFSTNPESEQQDCLTQTAGVWTLNDKKIIPDVQYTASISFISVLGLMQLEKKVFETQESNQKIEFPQINYQDYVKAEIQGKINLAQGSLSEIVSFQLVCAHSLDQNGVISQNFKSETSRQFKFDFEVLAKFTQTIECMLKPLNYLKPKEQPVKLASPLYVTQCDYEGDLDVFQFKITFTLLDQSKITNIVKDASIILLFNQPPPFVNQPSIQSGADGNAIISVSLVKGVKYILHLKIVHPEFKEFESQPILIDEEKDSEMKEKLELIRKTVIQTLESLVVDKLNKPVPSAKLSILNLTPALPDFTADPVPVEGNGSFEVKIACYYLVMEHFKFKIQIPEYADQTSSEFGFKCLGDTQQLKPVQLTLALPINVIFEGLVINPFGKPQTGLKLHFSTNPESEQQDCLTQTAGVWTLNDKKIIPDVQYTASISFISVLGLMQLEKKVFETQESNQKIEFPQINYQDYVKAEIQGKINLAQGSLSEIVSFQLVCAHSLDQNGVISQNFKSETSRQFKFDFEVLAKFTQTIECMLKPLNYLKPKEQPVKLASPLYVTQCDYEGDLDVFQFKITFTLLDQSKITNIVKDASIILLFNKPPPFVNQPSIQSGEDGNAIISVSLVKGVKYILHLKIVHPEFKEFESQPILIDEEKDSEMKEKLELIRKTVIQTLESSVVDKLNKPVPSAKLSILNLTPALPDFKADPVPVEGNGSFEVKIACYYLVMEHFKFKIQIPEYADQTSSEFGFKCLGDTQQLKPVQLTLALPINVIFEGLVINPFGKPQTGLKLHFSTNPESEQQDCLTQTAGVWTLNDKKIIPDVQYTASISFINVLGLMQLEKKVFETQESNQKIEFPQINYQDYVKAEIVGEIILQEGKIREAVKFKLSCPKFISQKGIIEEQFESQDNGKFKVEFQVLATKDSEIICTLQPESILQPTQMQVTLKSPDFRAELKFKDEINVVKLSLGFIAVDKTKLEKSISDVDITTKINPPLPLDDKLTCKTDTSSSCGLQLRLIQGIKYELTIMTKSSHFVDFISAPIELNSKEDSISQYELDLERIEISQQLNYQILDKQEQPYEYPKIQLKLQEPIVSDKTQLNSEYKGNQKGIVEFPLVCYKALPVKIKFMVIVFGYKDQETPEYTYNCDGTSIAQQKIVIDLILVGTTVTISGQVINPKGLGSGNQQLVITTNPNSQIKNSVSDDMGNFQTELLLKMESQYEIIVTIQKREYKRQFKTERLITQKMDYGKVYSTELETVKVHGLIKSMKGFIGINLDLHIKCEDQNEWIKTDYNGDYKYQFQLMAKFDDIYKCQLQTKGNEKFQAKISELTIKPPKFNYQFNLEIMETKPFDERVEKYFSKVVISGTVVSDFNCKNQPLKPVEQATVELIKLKQGNIMVIIDKDRTNEQGKFKINVYISNKQLSNMIEIKVRKQAFIPSIPLSVVPQIYYKEDTPIIIDLGYFPISPIAKNPDCPSS